MAKSFREEAIKPSLGCPNLRGSVAHTRALVGTIQASSWSRMINLRPLLACNLVQYFTFLASDVLSETIHILVRKSTPTETPRKIRLPQRLANYLWARSQHLIEVVWQIWDHFFHTVRSNKIYLRPQMIYTKKKYYLIIPGCTVPHSQHD
jgi:hypothetical protein